MQNEGLTRRFLLNVFRRKVGWIESAYGGTVGMPDAKVSIDGCEIALELKFWKWYNHKRGLLCLRTALRPVQRQWHFQAARRGEISALLVGFYPPELSGVIVQEIVGVDWQSDGPFFGLVRGDQVPMTDKSPELKMTCVKDCA